MKSFTIGIITTLFLSATAIAPIQASETAVNPRILVVKTSPVNLVYLAYRRYFSDRGIPSSQALVSAYSLGKISASELVEIGVETGRVSPNAASDQRYINGVESMLNSLKSR